MQKKVLRVMIVTIIMLGMLSVLSACEETNPREEVIFYINKLYEEKELKFIIERSDRIHTAVQKYDSNGHLVYMYNEIVLSNTSEITAKRLYQNGKDFDLITKTYYEIVLTQNSNISGMLPNIALLKLETTTYEKINDNEYFVTIYPQALLDDIDRVFEYTIMIESNLISEIHFAGNIISISRDVGEQIIIDESEFTRSIY